MRSELRRAHIQFYLRPKTILRLIGHLPSIGLVSYASWAFRYMKRILFREADDRRHLPVKSNLEMQHYFMKERRQ
jgi:hypothetical protein